MTELTKKQDGEMGLQRLKIGEIHSELTLGKTDLKNKFFVLSCSSKKKKNVFCGQV